MADITSMTLLAIWSKATAVPGFDARLFRKDACGALTGKVPDGAGAPIFGLYLGRYYKRQS